MWKEASLEETQRSLIAMKAIEERRALVRVNEAADRCFGECIDDFGLTRQLRDGEEECVRKCTLKFVEMSALVGQVFGEQRRL